MNRSTSYSLRWLPWGITAVFLILLLLLSQIGWWQSVATGAQVQVPMFYDAHYLFPRPWTQEQAAPGVPDPFPIALHGDNVISQPFTLATNELTAVSLWLAGDPETAVSLTLSDAQGNAVSGTTTLRHGAAGGWYRFATPLSAPVGSTLRLSLAAPDATSQQPVILRTIGGDRLGGAIQLNEFPRPGNLQLRTYSNSLLPALQSQLLPPTFQTRLPQYKPEPLKNSFGWLLGTTAVLSLLFLLLALPRKRPFLPTLGWLLATLLGGFLLWQIGSGRLLLPLLTRAVPTNTAQPITVATSSPDPRLTHDLTLMLWAAERKPEPRAIDTDVVQGYPAIVVPAASELGFPIEMPPNGELHVGLLTQEQVIYSIWFNGQELWRSVEAATSTPTWQQIDLSALAGQSGQLILQTEGDAGSGQWLQPQILAQTDWIVAQPPNLPPINATFNNAVALTAVSPLPTSHTAGEPLPFTLYWQALAAELPRATVFIHLLNEAGDIVAQQDLPPLGGAYPTSVWQHGDVIRDERQLTLPPDLPAGTYRLALGLYDPTTFVRWTAVSAAGDALADDRVILETAVTVEQP